MPRYYEETDLIEFIKQYTPTIEGETTLECVEVSIRHAPTADVVPRAELAREIFGEIEQHTKDVGFSSFAERFEFADFIAELKKKYNGD